MPKVRETQVTGKFGLGMLNEAEQRIIEFCQENALVIEERSDAVKSNIA